MGQVGSLVVLTWLHPHTGGFRIQLERPRLQVGLEMELGRITQPFGLQGRSDLCLFSRELKIILNQNLRAILKRRKERKKQLWQPSWMRLEPAWTWDLGLSVSWWLYGHLCLNSRIALSCTSDHSTSEREDPFQGLSLILTIGIVLYPAAPIQKALVAKLVVEYLDFAQDTSPK